MNEKDLAQLASDIPVGSNKVGFSSDGSDILVVIAKDTRSKIEAFKANVRKLDQFGQSLISIEGHKAIGIVLDTMSTSNENDPDNKIFGVIALDDRVMENLQKVATSSKFVNFVMVSDDLEVTYGLQVLNSPIMKTDLKNKLEYCMNLIE